MLFRTWPTRKPHQTMKAKIAVSAARDSTRIIVRAVVARNPVGRQQGQPDRDEMLLEVEEAKRRQMTVALSCGLTSTRKYEIHDRAQHSRDQIENDDGVGEGGGRHGAKAVEERPGLARRPAPMSPRSDG